MKKKRTGRTRQSANRPTIRSKRRSLEFEALETRNLLATIVWDNPDIATNGFGFEYGADAAVAKQIVEHAIADWERYISDFQYQQVGTPGNAPVANQYNVTIGAADLSGLDPIALGVNYGVSSDAQGKPYESTVALDDNAAGTGWYFDPTIASDSEFPVISDAFRASMNGGIHSGNSDFYTVVAHELGHALGLSPGHISVPGNGDLMSPSLFTGERRLISDITLFELTNPGTNGVAHDYALSIEATYPDNMFVKNIGSTLYVRGTAGNDAISIHKGGDGNMYAEVNGYIERTDHTTFTDFDIKSFAGDDSIHVSLGGVGFVDGGPVDLGSGTDTFIYTAPNDSANYGISVNGGQVHRPYLFVGPGIYHSFNYSGVEVVTLRGGDAADTISIGVADAPTVRAFGYGGNDSIMATGSTNEVQMWGGDNNDTLWSGSGDDYIDGEGGNDNIRGGDGNDDLRGGDQDDLIFGQGGDDEIRGGSGDDDLHGNSGMDTLFGDLGADTFNIWGPATTNDFIDADWRSPDNSILVEQRRNSGTSAVVDSELIYADSADFMWIRTQGGDDNIAVDAFMGIAGTVDGGDGIDTAVVPGNWTKVNTEL